MHQEACFDPETRPAVKRALSAFSAKSRHRDYKLFYEFDHITRICAVKDGLPSNVLIVLAADMDISRERLYQWLGIARATANRKVKANLVLSQDESERALGIARLVGQVEKIVTESGDPTDFDAAKWTAAWLEKPNAALGGRVPATFMDTADGRALISGLIAQMQSGAYA